MFNLKRREVYLGSVLQVLVQLTQQRMLINRRFKNPVVVQFVRLNVSADLQYMVKFRVGLNTNEGWTC